MPNDSPIESPCDDVLGRAQVAESFARHLLSVDATDGAVVGVFGPWGFGKTSFLNLAKHHLREPAYVVDFNPWLFSGTEQLIQQFFTALSVQIRALRLPNSKKVAKSP